MRSAYENRQLAKRAVRSGCARIPFDADLRDIRSVDDEEAGEFIYTPLTYDIGKCGNHCFSNQLTPRAQIRSNLHENFERERNHTVHSREVS